MKPITEYKDYRKFMQDFYDERKRTGAFSWREFSKLAGFASPTYLKLVCEGKSGLSKVKMKQVSKAMGLSGHEEEYFSLLVILAKATKDADKKAVLLKLEKIALEHKVRVVDSDAFQYYESWKYPVIRELAPMMPGAQPRKVADECKEYVSAEEVRDILAFLVKAGFLKKDGEKVYTQTEKAVIGSPEALPIAIRAMHKEMGNMAVRAVDRYSASERYFTGMTIGVNETNYARIVAEIDAQVYACSSDDSSIAGSTTIPNATAEDDSIIVKGDKPIIPELNELRGGEDSTLYKKAITFKTEPVSLNSDVDNLDVNAYSDEKGASATCTAGDQSFDAKFKITSSYILKTLTMHNVGAACDSILQEFRESCNTNPKIIVHGNHMGFCTSKGDLYAVCGDFSHVTMECSESEADGTKKCHIRRDSTVAFDTSRYIQGNPKASAPTLAPASLTFRTLTPSKITGLPGITPLTTSTQATRVNQSIRHRSLWKNMQSNSRIFPKKLRLTASYSPTASCQQAKLLLIRIHLTVSPSRKPHLGKSPNTFR